MENGIIIIAYKKEVYYEYAFNLATSIKLNSKCKIQLVCDQTIRDLILKNGVEELFDYITDIEKDYNPGELKIKIYDLSVFEKTIFIDCDSLIFPNVKIDWIFSELKGYKFVCANRDQFNSKKDLENILIFGGKFKEYIDFFGLENELMTSVFSYFMYFEKHEDTKDFFDEVKKIYQTLTSNKDKLTLIDWQGCVADELAFSIATCKKNFHPEIIGYSPILTDMSGEKGMFSHYLVLLNMVGKIGMTMPGERVHPHNIQMYDLTTSIIGIARGVKMFKWKNK